MAQDLNNMLNESARKMRVKESVEGAGLDLPRIGREAYKESYVVAYLRQKYDDKLKELEMLFSESATELALLGEKYRASQNEYEKNELVRQGDSIKTTMKRRASNLKKFNWLFKLFDEFNILIQAMLEAEEYRAVVKVIPEHKLVHYAKMPQGDIKLKPLVEQLMKKLESEARKAEIDLIEFEEFKKHQENVSAEFEAMIDGRLRSVDKNSVRNMWEAPAEEVKVEVNPFEAPAVSEVKAENPFNNTNRA